MDIFDSHTHANTMQNSVLELMNVAGITEVAICSFIPLAKNPETLKDHFEELCTFQKERIEKYGIEAHVFVGIHPLCIPENWKKAIEFVEEFLAEDMATGIGEVGLHFLNEREEDVLLNQLELAREYSVPAIVHTPPTNRVSAVEKIVKIAEKAKVDFGSLVIDHTSIDTIGIVKENNAIAGVSIKPGIVTPEMIVENLDDFEDCLLNSDCANVTDTDPLAVPKTVRYIMREGIEKKIVKRMCFDNAKKVYKV